MKKSYIEGVTAEQAASLSRYELDVIFFPLVPPSHGKVLCNRDD